MGRPPDVDRRQLQGRVAVVTVNRPEVLNALSSELLEELTRGLPRARRGRRVRRRSCSRARVTRAFIAGADIAELVTKTPLDGAPLLRARPGSLAPARDDAQAHDRGRQRLRARRRLRDGARLRLRFASTRRASGSPRSTSASSPAGAARSAWRARRRSASPRRSCSRAAWSRPTRRSSAGSCNAVFEPGELLPRTLEIAAGDRREEPDRARLRQGGDEPLAARRPRCEPRARGRPVRDPVLDRGRTRGPHGLHREAPAALHR